MKPVTRTLLLALLTFAPSLVSCAHKNNGADDGDFANGGGWDEYGGTGYDNLPLPSRDESVSFFGPGSANLDKSMFSPIYFSFDSYTLSESAVATVGQVATFLRGGRARLLIAGFTDAVGTEEYNRVLGEQRALTVRSALSNLGVDPSRIQTVSFGEDLPASPTDDNANRRAEFGVIR